MGPQRPGATRAPLRFPAACLAAFLLLLLPSCAGPGMPGGDLSPDRIIEERVFDLVNGYRSGAGLDRLPWDESLAGIARAHARRMADGTRLLSHRCFGFRTRLAAGLVGEGMLRENAGSVSESATPWSEVLTGWRFSASHRLTMLCESDITGVGAATSDDGEVFVVQLFYRRTRPSDHPSARRLAVDDHLI